jgi:hypothetical protein
VKPDAIRRAAIDSKHDGYVLDGSLTRREIIATLEDLRFARSSGFIETIHLDSDARDWLVSALRRP